MGKEQAWKWAQENKTNEDQREQQQQQNSCTTWTGIRRRQDSFDYLGARINNHDMTWQRSIQKADHDLRKNTKIRILKCIVTWRMTMRHEAQLDTLLH